jgi:DHA2 family multidrug resistance protein
MSGSFATAISVWIWNRRTDFHHAILTEHVRDSASGWVRYQADLGVQGIAGNEAFQYVDRLIEGQASTLAISDVFLVLGCMFFLLIPLIWLAKPPFAGGRGGAAH